MDIIRTNGRLTSEERETLLRYDNIEQMWIMDSSIPKHINKALKKGWTPIKKYECDDGYVSEMVLVAPERAITIRNIDKNNITDKQKEVLNCKHE